MAIPTVLNSSQKALFLLALVAIRPRLYRDAPTCARQEKCSNERIEIAVQHPLHLAHFEFRPMIFHELVGLQCVGANLASETDLQLGIIQLSRGLLPLLDLQFV